VNTTSENQLEIVDQSLEAMQASLNLRAEGICINISIADIRAAEDMGREAATYGLSMPAVLNVDIGLTQAYSRGLRKGWQEKIRSRQRGVAMETVLASPDMANSFVEFASAKRMEQALLEMELMLRVYGYKFVSGVPSDAFNDGEMIAIGNILFDAVRHHDLPHMESRRFEETRRSGIEAGSHVPWLTYLFDFLEAKNLGLVSAKESGSIYPELDPNKGFYAKKWPAGI
jgi:hypothetical protein